MRKLVLFVVLFGLWVLLVWSTDGQDLAAGFAVSLAVAMVFGSVFVAEPGRVLAPRRWFLFLFTYLPYFLYQCILSNFDVAYRVIHPDLPIRPGIVKVRTELRSDLARTFLANSITLTPGTLTVDIRGEVLYIHWINVPEDPGEWTRKILKRFERMLGEIFE